MQFSSAYVVLSSGKFASLTSLMNKNKSFMIALNKTEINMKPCGTPDKGSSEYHSFSHFTY